jgi:hypothetical protein
MTRKRRLNVASFVARVYVSLVVATLYFAACVSPAVEWVDVPRVSRDFGDIQLFHNWETGSRIGLWALVFGWSPPWTIPWSANLLLVIGWVLLLLNKNTLAWSFGTAAALLGLSTWALRHTSNDVQLNLRVGYYLWQASLIVFAVGSMAIWLRERNAPRRPQSRELSDPTVPPGEP